MAPALRRPTTLPSAASPALRDRPGRADATADAPWRRCTSRGVDVDWRACSPRRGRHGRPAHLRLPAPALLARRAPRRRRPDRRRARRRRAPAARRASSPWPTPATCCSPAGSPRRPAVAGRPRGRRHGAAARHRPSWSWPCAPGTRSAPAALEELTLHAPLVAARTGGGRAAGRSSAPPTTAAAVPSARALAGPTTATRTRRPWTRHASGVLVDRRGPAAATVDLTAWPPPGAEAVTSTASTTICAAPGYELRAGVPGPAARLAARRRVFAEVALPEGADADAAGSACTRRCSTRRCTR